MRKARITANRSLSDFGKHLTTPFRRQFCRMFDFMSVCVCVFVVVVVVVVVAAAVVVVVVFAFFVVVFVFVCLISSRSVHMRLAIVSCTRRCRKEKA